MNTVDRVWTGFDLTDSSRVSSNVRQRESTNNCKLYVRTTHFAFTNTSTETFVFFKTKRFKSVNGKLDSNRNKHEPLSTVDQCNWSPYTVRVAGLVMGHQLVRARIVMGGQLVLAANIGRERMYSSSLVRNSSLVIGWPCTQAGFLTTYST